MQYLKDDVKNNILSAALSEFLGHGYKNASMRQIANTAGITPGNIYRYFKSKEDLLDELLQPTYEQFLQYLAEIRINIERTCSKDNTNPFSYLNMIQSTLLELIKESSSEFRIMLNLSAGSKYEHVKQDLIEFVIQILEQFFLAAPDLSGPVLAEMKVTVRMISTTLVEGMCMILRDHEDGATVRRLANELLHLYSAGICERLSQ
ncbi:TetR/AcrR family transcriptional regulator [Paenibacillus guangzhouensis]|uniref:TetR/AcrR family transcriptional regulator n=1 Tax=Paenibacillus guangzhouensis TaxID=1473112 RepID=UPI0012670957|nr:TetR/AcrR family transcriptional regulator [Paenibacillus guangzhouensis]